MEQEKIKLQIYGFYRDEIKREDEITHHRLTTSMAFQGFLKAATGFLVSGPWPHDSPLTFFRLNVIGGIGIIGLLVAACSMVGVFATRASIRDVKQTMPQFDPVLGISLPQTHGRGSAFDMGDLYTRSIPICFTVMWELYLIVYFKLIWNIEFKTSVLVASVLFISLFTFVILWSKLPATK